MIEYGTVYGTSEPDEVEIYESKVFVNSDATSEEKTMDGETHIEWAWTQIEYTKDEYIQLQADAITNLELALVELYESIS